MEVTKPHPACYEDYRVTRAIDHKCIDCQVRGDCFNNTLQPVGEKKDSGKLRWSLLPAGTIADVLKVLEFGALKYSLDNWQHVGEPRRRYYDAAMRHLDAWWGGDSEDSESGVSHLAHAACCILFLMWFEKNGDA